VGNKLVVVDVANIRPHFVHRKGFLQRRVKTGAETLTSLDYIDSLLLAISNQVPSATVVAIADRVLRHRFEDRADEFAFDQRADQLDRTDPEFIYQMPFQQSKNPMKPSRRNPNYVKADELILTVAAATNGLVVSGDYYMDDKYRSLADWLAASHYIPFHDPDAGSWLLCEKPKFFDLSKSERLEIHRLRSIAGVDPMHVEKDEFDKESDEILRRQVFDVIIPKFWSERTLADRPLTVGDQEGAKQRPFAFLRLPNRAKEVPSLIVPSSIRAEVTPAHREEVVADVPSSATVVREERPVLPSKKSQSVAVAQLLASSSGVNVRYLNQVVQMIGQIFMRSDGQFVLRWVLPSGTIRIIGNPPQHVRIAIDVVKIEGLLRMDGDELVLDLDSNPSQFCQPLDMYQYYEKRLRAIRAQHLRPRIRRWTFPSIPKSTTSRHSSYPVAEDQLPPELPRTPAPQPVPSPSLGDRAVRPEIPKFIERELVISRSVLDSVDQVGKRKNRRLGILWWIVLVLSISWLASVAVRLLVSSEIEIGGSLIKMLSLVHHSAEEVPMESGLIRNHRSGM